ncbi:TPA: thiol reductase thioredoxin [Citrobacter farmeri]|uniref:Conjugal transfer protein TraF n=4 Tax=Citrobacter TaxID=544 RepID=A0AAD1X5L3_CITFR|nr:MULTISPECIES: conjugal transfer protein TraF [Enterobacteriaceae]EHK0947608.1 conjugal transfer protein TraF [Citrobacter farmeri]EKT9197062.1 conjugal transfer protein TraF [Citrobacter freundii]EKW5624323.1 conjugal transfer protein TraF [Citrobacter freundii]EKX4542952.1 conjugal transfer protein TraF [Citrobacter farmeri]EKX4543948.1 conjugal transfer protein TraF [Citrobacter farmeri]
MKIFAYIFILLSLAMQVSANQSTDVQLDPKLISQYLLKNKHDFALLFFVQPGCVYCQHQLPVIGEFQNQSGWYVKTIDIIQNPEVRSKFNVSATPVIIMIKRNGSANNWQTVSIGYSPLAMLRTDIFKLTQIMNGSATTGKYNVRTQQNAITKITE